MGLGPRHIALDGDPAPLPKKGAEPPSPIFGPFLLWPNGWMHQGATWYRGRPQRRRLLDGDPAPSPKRGRSPQFSAHVYTGQTAGFIKMPLGTEVGLSPGDNVLDGDATPSQNGGGPPICGPCLLWPNGWMDQDSTWYGGRPRPRRHCVRWGPSPPTLRPPKKGHSPQFSAHICCGQTAGWIKMPLGTEVGLGLYQVAP